MLPGRSRGLRPLRAVCLLRTKLSFLSLSSVQEISCAAYLSFALLVICMAIVTVLPELVTMMADYVMGKAK